jgi:hypothetical protein
MRALKCVLAIAALVPFCLACSFERQVVNAQFRDLDVSFIKIGKTSFYDVIDHIGPPSPVKDLNDNVNLVSDRHLRYICVESRTTSFLFAILLVAPFQWTDSQTIDEIFIEVDQKGLVSGVYRTMRDTVRPPFESSEGRPALHFEDLTASLR